METKKRRSSAVRWNLVFIDMVCYAVVCLMILVVYPSSIDHLTPGEAFANAILGLLCVFAPRLLLGIYQCIWRYAGSGCKSDQRLLLGEDLELVANMDGSMHECLLYLPLFAEVDSVQIAVEASARIEPLPRPFRHRIGVWGSSFTHGTGVSRAGMTYVAQLSRLTGLEMLSLGCSGHSKLQPYFARVLAAAQADAFLFDCFSNPSPGEIRERLLPFIETVRQALPGIPLVFQRTIRREGRNFNLKADSLEAAKIAVADSMMALACRRYSDVYYITPSATPPDHLSSVDGVHPDDYGYTLWARSLRGQLLPILKKYGIE